MSGDIETAEALRETSLRYLLRQMEASLLRHAPPQSAGSRRAVDVSRQ